MSMNFLDAAGVLADSAELPFRDLLAHEAKSIVQAVVDAYDALAPDWAEAPDDAQWYTIDANGACTWHEVEPTPFDAVWESGTNNGAGVVIIPFGIDWRLLKWQRLEVSA